MPLDASGKVPCPRQNVACPIVQNEEAVAIQFHVGGVAGSVARSLGKIRFVRRHLHALTQLDRIPGTAGSELLREEVGEVGGLRLGNPVVLIFEKESFAIVFNAVESALRPESGI